MAESNEIEEKSTFVVEEDVSPESKALAAQMLKEQEDAPPAEGSPTEKEAPPAEDTDDSPIEGSFSLDEFNSIIEEKGYSKAEIANALRDEVEWEIDVKGGSVKKVTYQEALNTLKRRSNNEVTHQKRYNDVMKDHGELIAMHRAAKGGDKSAQKAMVELVQSLSGSKDGDELLDSLDSIEEKFDAEAEVLKAEEAQDAKDIFADLDEEGVDYQPVLDNIPYELRNIVPPNLIEDFMGSRGAQRVLYDLVTSPDRPLFESKFQDLLGSLSPDKRLEVKGDPRQFELLFYEAAMEVAKDRDANSGQSSPNSQQTEEKIPPGRRADALVSDGTQSRGRTTKPAMPDFDGMSKQEFAEYQREHGLL